METEVFVRHSKKCPHKHKRYHRNCRCRKWILFIGEDRRISAQTRSWEGAVAKAKLLADVADGKPTASPERQIVRAAVAAFLEDKRIQNVKPNTLTKLRGIFEKQLGGFCKLHGLVYLDDLTLGQLEKFRASWKDKPLARKKKQERVRGFLRYCVNHDWVTKNAAAGLSIIRVDPVPTDYFTKEQFTKLVDTVPQMYTDKRGTKGNPEQLRQRMLALILLLRWSGLRIGDGVSLERSRLHKDGRLLLSMQKTGEPLFTVLPPDVTKRLHDLPNSNRAYFFWTGNGLVKSAVADWQRALRPLFAKAALGKRSHAQMFRDTFAIECLLAGVPIDLVSKLLGHSSVKITEKHYAPWVRARQEQLEASVRKTWKKSEKLKLA